MSHVRTSILSAQTTLPLRFTYDIPIKACVTSRHTEVPLLRSLSSLFRCRPTGTADIVTVRANILFMSQKNTNKHAHKHSNQRASVHRNICWYQIYRTCSRVLQSYNLLHSNTQIGKATVKHSCSTHHHSKFTISFPCAHTPPAV